MGIKPTCICCSDHGIIEFRVFLDSYITDVAAYSYVFFFFFMITKRTYIRYSDRSITKFNVCLRLQYNEATPPVLLFLFDCFNVTKRSYMCCSDRGITQFHKYLRFQCNEVVVSIVKFFVWLFVCFYWREALIHSL